MVRPAQFLGPLPGDQPTLPAPARRTRRVPPQPRTRALASDLRSSLAVHLSLQPQLSGHLGSNMPQRYHLGSVRDFLQEWMVSVDTTTHGNMHRDTSEVLKSRVCNGPLA